VPSPTARDVAFHDWFVEAREHRRHESRRGRRHAFEHVDPPRTALVVIDLVPFFVQESAFCRGIVPQVNTLAHELRAAGGTVAWVVPGYREPTARDREFLGDDIAEMFARSGGTGEPIHRLWPDLTVCDGDLAVEKTATSAFFPGSSRLPELLEARGIDTVLVTGTVTNVCVEGSVRDAATLGLRVILVADACAAMRDQDHNAALHVVYRTYGDVRSTDEVVGLIRAGRPTSGCP
jgi:nicotinamidase-related amidase